MKALRGFRTRVLHVQLTERSRVYTTAPGYVAFSVGYQPDSWVVQVGRYVFVINEQAPPEMSPWLSKLRDWAREHEEEEEA